LKQFIFPRLQKLLHRQKRKYYRDFWALNNVSFEIKKGETVGIVGRNGSGKSTLLQMICGTLNYTSGNIHTNGRIAALLELGSGFNPEFSGRENVYLNGAILGLSNEEICNRFDSILNFSEIGDFIEQPVKTYSSGMLVRLAFAVQTLVDPDILIVDEALAVGDERFQRKCFARLEELKKGGTSILFVSHSGPQIVELCDRAFLLHQGECLLQAKPLDVIRSYQRLIYANAEEQKRLVMKMKAGEVAETSSLDAEPIQNFAGADTCMNEYDPSLTVATTERYPENGARIDGFEIRDSNGKLVNVLTAGKQYTILMYGEFLSVLERVHFAIHIRSISGTVITGQRVPEDGAALEWIDQGKKFQVTFKFNLALLSGSYFVGGAVWAKEPTCAHRILDALIFKVLPKEKRFAFGCCDLSSDVASISIQ
jgi:lipopolysaccharide transport system ATP-binding protein